MELDYQQTNKAARNYGFLLLVNTGNVTKDPSVALCHYMDEEVVAIVAWTR
jgi:hypothetical protein